MLIAGLILSLVGGLLLATAFVARMGDRSGRERYRRIVETPTTPIAKLPTGGLVEIHGRAIASDQGYVTSPVTGRQLLVCYAEVFVDRGRRDGGTSYWSEHIEDLRRDFWLDDGSGERAYISPRDAKVVLGGTRFAEGHSGVVPDVNVPMHAAPLTQGIHGWATRVSNRPGRGHVVHEHAIAESDYVYTIGEAHREGGLLVLRKMADNDVIVSNLSEQQLRALYETMVNRTTWLFRIAAAVLLLGAALLVLHGAL